MVTNTRTGQVNDGVNTLQRLEVDVTRCWIPRRLTRIHSRSPDKSDDGVGCHFSRLAHNAVPINPEEPVTATRMT